MAKKKNKDKKDKSNAKKKGKKKDKKKRSKADPGASVKDPQLYERLRDDGASKKKAARVANAASGTSRKQVGQRGGSAPAYDEWTRAALYQKARDVDVTGRSGMSKQELIDALRSS
jgi:hypothetical protein